MAFTFLILAFFIVRAWAVFNIDTSLNAVGIGYSVWHSLGYNGQTAPPDITEIEAGNGTFAAQGVFHFWGQPAGGYYQGGDRGVLNRHFSQISEAGIDFVVIDATNLQGYGNYQVGLFTEPMDVFLDQMRINRDANQTTPYVVFWAGTASSAADPSAVGRYINDRYYSNSSYSDFWVTMSGKPLLITTDALPANLASNFTLRKMWGLQTTLAQQEWSFLQNVPQNVAMNGAQPEQISVCVAKQSSYISDKATATSRNQGQTFQAQWQEAFSVKPKVVFLTWWNEWMAQRQVDSPTGQPQFVDEYDGEYSRDIEPQDPSQPTSHGSYYHTWTKAYIAAYKANQTMPGGLTGY